MFIMNGITYGNINYYNLSISFMPENFFVLHIHEEPNTSIT